MVFVDCGPVSCCTLGLGSRSGSAKVISHDSHTRHSNLRQQNNNTSTMNKCITFVPFLMIHHLFRQSIYSYYMSWVLRYLFYSIHLHILYVVKKRKLESLIYTNFLTKRKKSFFLLMTRIIYVSS